jgi:hypothetical protein
MCALDSKEKANAGNRHATANNRAYKENGQARVARIFGDLTAQRLYESHVIRS